MNFKCNVLASNSNDDGTALRDDILEDISDLMCEIADMSEANDYAGMLEATQTLAESIQELIDLDKEASKQKVFN